MSCCLHEEAPVLTAKVGWLVAFIAFCVMAARMGAYWVSDSLVLEAVFFDAIKDFSVSVFNIFAIKWSMRPPDRKYPFGYGKIETLVSLAQAVLLFAIGGLLLYKSAGVLMQAVGLIQRAVEGDGPEGSPVDMDTIGLQLFVLSLFLLIILVAVQTFFSKKTKSVALWVDAVHYKADILTGFIALFCIIASRQAALPWIEGVFSLIIAFYFFKTSIFVISSSLRCLLDASLQEETLKTARSIVLDVVNNEKDLFEANEQKECFSLVTKSLGRNEFFLVNLNIERAGVSLERTAGIVEKIEKGLLHAFPSGYVVVTPKF
ncbi:MAG: cation diffusion facilitator family transporter [Holosporales bacterium]|nr:cation diffusion facilitator family transporter [Holosporales bacterium]